MPLMIVQGIAVQGDQTRLVISEPGTREGAAITIRSLWFGPVPARFQLGDQIELGETSSLWFPRGVAGDGIPLEHVSE
ncbi:hypothetical protein SAMN05444166_0230 [Singulisphaera sp. GP187]|uniref:hypothetical protein n=1 Tax=Singulisphaera sp. GP187 TaxID=1882752 RepID=UPI0009297057|nr:hypothetical protein [Singulisphaera sp. GP187]SIN70053.1 hypothetical protein SAMN05444166_0230 [Singulisphaera sp. GP187]